MCDKLYHIIQALNNGKWKTLYIIKLHLTRKPMRRRQKGKVMVFNGSVPHLRSEAALPWRARGGDVLQWRRNVQVGIQDSMGDPQMTPSSTGHAEGQCTAWWTLTLPFHPRVSPGSHMSRPRRSHRRTVKANQTSSLQRPVKTSAKHLDKQRSSDHSLAGIFCTINEISRLELNARLTWRTVKFKSTNLVVCWDMQEYTRHKKVAWVRY